jgi:hypothetical protein
MQHSPCPTHLITNSLNRTNLPSAKAKEQSSIPSSNQSSSLEVVLPLHSGGHHDYNGDA